MLHLTGEICTAPTVTQRAYHRDCASADSYATPVLLIRIVSGTCLISGTLSPTVTNDACRLQLRGTISIDYAGTCMW